MSDNPRPEPTEQGAPRPESYLYERAIDALVVFAARYLRTAKLLMRHPRSGAAALLEELEEGSPRLMRPLGFLACSYTLFLVVLWKISNITSAQAALNMTERFLGGMGSTEIDLLQSVLVAPLPGVILVALLSSQASRRLLKVEGSARRQATAVLQYSVGHGLNSLSLALVLLRVMGQPLIWSETRPLSAGGFGGFLDNVLGVYSLLLVGLVFVLVVLVTIASVSPVARTLRIHRQLADLSRPRRLGFVCQGPLLLSLLLGLLLTVMLRNIFTDDQFIPPFVEFSEQRDNEATMLLRLEAPSHRPAEYVAWRAFAIAGMGFSFNCTYLDRAGEVLPDYPARIGDDSVLLPKALEHELRVVSPAGQEGPVTLQPGEKAWVELTTRAPDVPLDRNISIHACTHLAHDASSPFWKEAGSFTY